MTAQAALALEATCRWAVTGTPVQNGLPDLFSLFRFVQVYPYSERGIVDKDIITPWAKGDREGAVKRLKKLLQYIMLRRPTNIIALPKRTDTVLSLKFDEQERAKYQKSAQATVQCLDDLLHSNATPGGHKNAVTKINALRMTCNLGCQQKSNFKDWLDPQNLPSRQSSVFEGAGAGTETLDCSDTPGLIETCKICGILISNSESLIAEDSGYYGTQNWCSSCLLDSADSVENSLESDVTHLENISVQTGIAKRQWPTKIRALLEDVKDQDSATKWSVASQPTDLPLP